MLNSLFKAKSWIRYLKKKAYLLYHSLNQQQNRTFQLQSTDMDTAPFFEYYYNNAEVNSILILDSNGVVLDINQAFSNNFGYKKEDIKGKDFTLLFIPRDKEKGSPQHELETVLSKGQAHDENYIVNKSGHAIWCTGESTLAVGKDGKKYIIKDIINLQARKQLQLFLKDTDELLERIFESSKDIPMMIMDGSMKIQKVNGAFLQLFEIEEAPLSGSRLSDLHHPFWIGEDIKTEVRKILVENQALVEKEFLFHTKAGEQKSIRIDTKIIERPSNIGRQVFIIFEDVTPVYQH
jgi:PAS domain S-box-containing protein